MRSFYILLCPKPKNAKRFLILLFFGCFFFNFILFILVLHYYNRFFCILYMYPKIIDVMGDKSDSKKKKFEANFIL